MPDIENELYGKWQKEVQTLKRASMKIINELINDLFPGETEFTKEPPRIEEPDKLIITLNDPNIPLTKEIKGDSMISVLKQIFTVYKANRSVICQAKYGVPPNPGISLQEIPKIPKPTKVIPLKQKTIPTICCNDLEEAVNENILILNINGRLNIYSLTHNTHKIVKFCPFCGYKHKGE